MKFPKAYMTDEYVEVIKPGQTFGIIEIIPLNIDSTFGYPKEEKKLKHLPWLTEKIKNK